MTELRQRVKNALDEGRILVLGTQVLLGFQYRAFFEEGFEKLPPLDRAFELAALGLLLATAGSLFTLAARHRLVEHGNDSGAFHHFAMLMSRISLFPFACALSLELFVAGDRIGGFATGIACGAVACALALGFWYGLFLHPGRNHDASEEPMQKTDLEHRVIQVLTEARVVIPGAQALLGFQLAMILMTSFDKLPKAVKLVHLGSLFFVAAATVTLMSTAAYHRIVERGNDTERFHTFASRMVLLALALLGLGFSAELYVILRKLEYARVAPVAAVAALATFYVAWFGWGLKARRHRVSSAAHDRPPRAARSLAG